MATNVQINAPVLKLHSAGHIVGFCGGLKKKLVDAFLHAHYAVLMLTIMIDP